MFRAINTGTLSIHGNSKGKEFFVGVSICAFIFVSEIKMEVRCRRVKLFGSVFSLVVFVSDLKLVVIEIM